MTAHDWEMWKFLKKKQTEGFHISCFIQSGRKQYLVIKGAVESYEEAYNPILEGDWLPGLTPDNLGGLGKGPFSEGCPEEPLQPWQQDPDHWKKGS